MLYLGDTLEQKKESYEILTRRAKKTGNVFKWIGIVMAVCLSLIVIFAAEDMNVFAGLLIALLALVVYPLAFYCVGVILYYAFVTVKSWLAKWGIGVATTAAVAGESIAIAHLIGGRKSAKRMGIFWLIVICLFMVVGIYAGIFNYFMVRKEAKKLGIA